MRVGVPKEIKTQEYRVGATPGGVSALLKAGAKEVMVQEGAGVGSGFSNDEYKAAGATIVDSAEKAWAGDLVIKVKEPIASEFKFLRDDLTLFTYLHLAAAQELATALLDAGTTGIAYETVEPTRGSLPLLTPMSAVAGRLAVQEGMHHLTKPKGGRGVLLSGVPGVPRAKVSIIGGGVVGANAAQLAIGLGADVTILDIKREVLEKFDELYGNRVSTIYSRTDTLGEIVSQSDLVIGAVLVAGDKAPTLVNRAMLKSMVDGSVIVDVAVDQGGCVETTRPTTHDEPTFVEHGVIHYCVANMPGAVPRTSTLALTSETLPYAMRLVKDGVAGGLKAMPGFSTGVNTFKRSVVHQGVASALDTKYTPLAI